MFQKRVTTIGFVLLGTAVLCATSPADETHLPFSVPYAFDTPNPTTNASPLGSNPDTRPVFGSHNTLFGMTADGGSNGNGVIYRFSLESRQYTVLHTFSAVDANGTNPDGAIPGVALTRGSHEVFYGMASFGGKNGTGTIFEITASGVFTVLHTFSALDANAHNGDGAFPLRTIVIGKDGNLYGTTRAGGQNSCSVVGCGVAWVMDRTGGNFKVLHQFTADEGHAASLLQARDGMFYGCAVWPNPTLPSGTLFQMSPSGSSFKTLYAFHQMNGSGANIDGADCYEPLLETEPGVFYGSTYFGGANASGVVFRYSLSTSTFEVVHAFSAVNKAGANSDGANPQGRLTPGEDGAMYSTAEAGGANGNGVVYSVRPNGDFKVLHTFSAGNPTTGANTDGAIPDYGVVLHDDSLFGIAPLGGNGSSAGFNFTGGTLYQLKLDD